MLVVEDNENDLFLLKHELKKSDYDFEIVHVNNLEDLKCQLNSCRFDIIISDYSLAGFTGKDVLALHKAMKIKSPIVILSGNIGEDTAVSLIKSGANDFVLKDRIEKINHVVKREITYFENKSEIRNLDFKFKNLFEGSSDFIGTFSCEKDNFGVIINMNESCTEFLGLNGYGTEITIDDFLKDPSILNAIKNNTENPEELKTETEFVNRDGKSIHVDFKTSFITYDDDKLAMFVARDITDRIIFEERILKNQQELTMRLKQLTSIHKISNIEEDDSLSFEDAVRMIVSEIPSAFPFDSSVELFYNGISYSSPLFEREFIEHEFPLFKSKNDGSYLKILFYTENDEYTIQREENEYIFSVIEVIVHLIEKEKNKSYLREKEMLFNILFENNHSLMLMSDYGSGKILDANNTACEFYGYTKNEFKKLNMIDLEASKYHTETDHEKGKPFYTKHVLKSGTEKEVEVFSGFGFLENKSIVFSIIHDITSQKAFENTLRKVISDKDLLLKEVHHRVKNNLQIVSSILILESLKITDESALEAINSIQHRIKLMSIIHQDLYEYEDLTKINLSSFVNGLFIHVYSLMNIKGKCKSYSINVDEVKLDINKVMDIGQILNELLSNIFKHGMNEDSGKIIVKIKSIDNRLSILVYDNGNGFPEDFNDRKLNSLGYMIVEELVNKYSGSIEIKSEKGLWAMVTVNLLIT